MPLAAKLTFGSQIGPRAFLPRSLGMKESSMERTEPLKSPRGLVFRMAYEDLCELVWRRKP